MSKFEKFFWNLDDPDHEAYCRLAWNACKKEILDILNTPIQNLDLSTEEIDKRFIERIEKEI